MRSRYGSASALSQPTAAEGWDWTAYYAWSEEWLRFPTTWAVIPDVIDGGEAAQDALLREWPHGGRGVPVWHMDEPIDRLLALCENWAKVCIGSTSVYATVLSDLWCRRMDEAWDAIARRNRALPWVHMLRGMACAGRRWPFASVDSTDVARNHHCGAGPRKLAERWDRVQCPGVWHLPEDAEPGAQRAEDAA